jgi:hypothetical protein
MAYDVRDYDNYQQRHTANTFARLRDVNNEQQAREIDPLVGGLADKLRQLFTAAPVYGHIDPDAAAVLLLERWPRPRFERI